MKKQEFKKMRRGLISSRTTLKSQHLNHRGARRRKGRTRNEKLFEKILKENFPNLTKEIDFQEVQEAQRVPKKLDPRKHTPRHIIMALAKIKEKERI